MSQPRGTFRAIWGFTLPLRVGFTLTEVLMVVAVMGILAGMAMPTYTKYRERSLWRAARDLLLTIHAGEQVFRTQSAPTTTYTTVPTDCPGNWGQIYMDCPNGGVLPVTFVVGAGGGGIATTFTATATRNGGPCDGMTVTIDQGRTVGGNWGTPQGAQPEPAACHDY